MDVKEVSDSEKTPPTTEGTSLPSLEDLESAYARAQHISDPESKAQRLNAVACNYHTRYQGVGGTADLEKAVSVHEEVMQSISASHPQYGEFVGDLCAALSSRFDQNGAPADIDRAILLYEKAVEVIQDTNPDRAGLMGNLGVTLMSRYKRLGKVEDLNSVIATWTILADFTADIGPSMPDLLGNIGVAFMSRFERLGNPMDLGEAISRGQSAVNLAPDEHPQKLNFLYNLGNALLMRFNHLGSLADLEQAISYQQSAVDLTPEGHPNKSGYLSILGGSLKVRFSILGNLADLKKAISLQQDALKLTSDEHPHKPYQLNSLSSTFKTKFDTFGELADLEQAISLQQNAVDIMPGEHPIKAHLLNNLSNSFQTRFNRLGSLADLEQAISLGQSAVDLTPDEDPHKPALLNNLGNAFQERFRRIGNLADLEKAISIKQNVVDITPEKHADRPIRLSSLGVDLQARSIRLESLDDLERAVSLQQTAFELTPDKHPDKLGILNNLGNVFEARFNRLGTLTDLEEAITFKQEAIGLTPDGHPDKPILLSNLGATFHTRFKRLGDHADRESAISAFSAAAGSPTGTPMVRFKAAQAWAQLLSDGSRSPLPAFQCAIGLLPRVAWLGLTVPDQHVHLAQVGKIVRDAITAAIKRKEYRTAVEWAEQGRSIVWQNLLGLRSPVDDLRKVSSELADKLEDVSKKLERSGSRDGSINEVDVAAVKQVTQRASALAAEWDQIVEKIRKLPSFEDFLKAKGFDKLAPAAHEGPVVILNVHEDQCDALILKSDELTSQNASVIHVPLTGFSYKVAEDLSQTLNTILALSGRSREPRKSEREGYSAPDKDLQFKEILSTLWLHVAKPVIDELGYQIQPITYPRVWWCATGPLAFLPIHAAGIYDETAVGEKLSDYVASSYTPTLTAILASSRSITSQDFQLLTIAQPLTPYATPLPGTTEEVKLVNALTGGLRIESLANSEATVERVLRAMERSTWIHLACHGKQDSIDSMKSGFLLHDKILELSEIIRAQLPKVDFAFLSACQTATGDEKVAEESMHLAAGMLFSGCRGVVATMWSIGDEDAPQVAADVYRMILENGKPDKSRAAYALHQAVQRLQQSGAGFLSWVPFIHIGR